jgi:itaconyl-CoA hydratase
LTPSDLTHLTGTGNYFEDFQPGIRIRHARGKTVTEMDNVMITNMVMNTADAHFDEHVMKSVMFGRRVVFGGFTLAMILGLAAQDTAEHAIAELSLDKIRLKAPVFHGDTLYAFSEVLAVEAGEDPASGIVTFRHRGENQDGVTVFEGDRRVLLQRRPTAEAS